ncbi:MAG: polyprenyl synthetase family protein [Betaproteobacteria bacterium]
MDARVKPTPDFDLSDWSVRHLAQVERALTQWVPDAPGGLGQAMRYAVLGGGKRLRALLVMAASEAWFGDAQQPRNESVDAAALRVQVGDAAVRAACSVELIHAYSLVHDDMPCMDNDVLRRGKPTVHVRFGQAQALLAGDALQALAFELLVPADASVPGETAAALCRLLARAAGCHGMAGGQAIDLASVGCALTQDQLQTMHRLKTGALLQASVLMGAACAQMGDVAAPAQRASAQQALSSYGAALGLACQVVDDMLEVTADSSTLGKTAGKDAASDKPTFVSLLGLDGARQYAHTLLRQAFESLEHSGLRDTRALQALADMLVNREK